MDIVEDCGQIYQHRTQQYLHVLFDMFTDILYYFDTLGGADYSSGGFGQDYQSSYGGGPMKSSGGYGASRSQPYGGDGTTKLPGVLNRNGHCPSVAHSCPIYSS